MEFIWRKRLYKKPIITTLTIGMIFSGNFISIPKTDASAAADIQSPFSYEFNVAGRLEEASSEGVSSSPYWWVNSGGRLVIEGGVGKTIQGDLGTSDAWRKKYAVTNPEATDLGVHPQNVFNMFLRKSWQNVTQEIYTKISKENITNPLNSQPWNGISLISRYTDENNFYYGGIRFDGGVVVKKKQNGIYNTLNYRKILPGTYSKLSNPNLIPKNTWIGLKMETTNESNGVRIKVYMDNGRTGIWTLVGEALDNGSVGSPMQNTGKVAIRSDFMDTQFESYKLISTDASDGGSDDTEGPVEDYGLSPDRSIQEAGAMSDSSDPIWWVNSGGYFNIASSIGKTNQGNLPSTDRWRTAYASANPLDTDNGYHPQNIFRLVTRENFLNYEQQGYFKINADNLSTSPNREGHNGLLFFNRYQSGQNLYYTGIRVDGTAIIKKKLNSTYYTLAQPRVYVGTYNRSTNPNLIPHNQWIGIKSVVKNNTNGSVNIKLYMDKNNTGTWELITEVTDDGSRWGTPIRSGASVGVRTDFMDVELKGYSLKNI